MMNEYLINIGKDLASKLPDSHFDYNINGVCNLQLSVFNEFTNEILFKILKETSLTKSSGLDEISTRLLVDAFYAIPDILVKFNFSLKNGQIPQCFKIAKVRGGGTKKKVGGLTLPLNDCTEAGVHGLHSEEFFSPLASEKVVGLSPPPTLRSVGGGG